MASIKYLIDNKCAIVADCENELYKYLTAVIDDQQQLREYAVQAYMCGRAKHDKKQQRALLQQDLLVK